jgi:hypothetical protein
LLSQRILISVLVLIVIGAPAWATQLTYSSQSGLESANTDLQFVNISFSAYFGFTGPSVTVGGVTFTDSTGGNLTVDTTGLLKDLTADSSSGGTIVVTLPSNALAFGVDVQDIQSFVGITVSFTGDGTPFSVTTASGSTTFFGARDSSSLNGLTLAPQFNFSGNNVELSNFEIGTGGTPPPPATPEAATLFLIGGGLIAMRFLKKRDKTRGKRRPTAPVAPLAGYVSPQVAAS